MSELIDLTIDVIDNVTGSVAALIHLNYLFVSFLVDCTVKFYGICIALCSGFKTSVSDLIDQYGEFCWNLVQLLAWSGRQAFSFIANVQDSGLKYFAHALAGIRSASKLPVSVLSSIRKGTLNMSGIVSNLIRLPFQLISSIFHGISMICSGIWNVVISILSGIYSLWATLFRGVFAGIQWFCSSMCSMFYTIISAPFRAISKIGHRLIETPQEAVYGLLICLLLFCLYRMGVLQRIFRLWRALTIQCAQWSASCAWNVTEGLLTLYAPYVPIIVAVVRRTYRPALRLARWSVSVWWSLMRLIMRRFSIFSVLNRNRNRPATTTTNNSSLSESRQLRQVDTTNSGHDHDLPPPTFHHRPTTTDDDGIITRRRRTVRTRRRRFPEPSAPPIELESDHEDYEENDTNNNNRTSPSIILDHNTTPSSSSANNRYSLRRRPISPQTTSVDHQGQRSFLTPSNNGNFSASAAASSPERLLCVICQDAEKTVMLEPCRHVCTCAACTDSLLLLRNVGNSSRRAGDSSTMDNGNHRRCPLCRELIERTVSVFI